MRGGTLTLNEAEVWPGARPDPIRNLRVHGGQARLLVMSQDGEIVRKKCQRWNTPWQAHGLTFSCDALRHNMLMTGKPVIRVVDGRAPSLPAPPRQGRRANTTPLRGDAALLRSTSDARRPRLEGATNPSTSLGCPPAGCLSPEGGIVPQLLRHNNSNCNDLQLLLGGGGG